ncbi:MAG TPA: hypothetical protein VEI57_07260 [Nitrospirota bacterium]|nr:hypothetical protein [Nitrospirota bacterium]
MLSNSTLQWGVYSGSTITLNTVNPAEGIGEYQAVASAGEELYNRSAFPGSANITSSSPTVTFETPLTVVSPWMGNTVTGVISMANSTRMDNEMDTGVVFAVYGGKIVDAISTLRGDLPQSDVSTGGTYIQFPISRRYDARSPGIGILWH